MQGHLVAPTRGASASSRHGDGVRSGSGPVAGVFGGGLATVPGPVWVSDPADIRRSENKALQLRRAGEVGLDVPETLWSNDVDEARAFLTRVGGAAVAKSVASAWWEGEAEGHFVFATPVVATDLPDALRLATAPVCFQRRVSPKHDIASRGDWVESVLAAIRDDDPAPDESEPLDWRLAPQRDWTRYDLPQDIASGCRDLVHSFRLRFGAIDLAMDSDGRH